MKSRPIIFSGPMIRALLEGRKTQTRRIVKPQPECTADSVRFPWATFYEHGIVHTWDRDGVGGQNWDAEDFPGEDKFEVALSRTPYENACPYGQPGDLLWVRETWAGDDFCGVVYRADHPDADIRRGDLDDGEQCLRQWRPSIFMPRWASRLTLELTDVRVQRLMDISEADATAEGTVLMPTPVHRFADHRVAFTVLWNSINGPTAWNSNPWVWALAFKVHQVNVDEFMKKGAA